MRHSVWQITACAVLTVALGLSTSARAADPAGAPAATAPAAAAPVPTSLKVVVAEVVGNVQARADANAAWEPVKVGMELGEGAELRTGIHSSVTCSIPPDQFFKLERLGTVKVAQAIRSGNKVKTEMLMKYGRTDYSIEAAGLEHESTIVSPSSTLAVRGTVVSSYDQPPFEPEAVSYTGRAMFRNAQRELSLGGKGTGKAVVRGNQPSAAHTALNDATVDPRDGAAALTAADAAFISSQVAKGGIVSYDQFAQITVLRDTIPNFNDASFAVSLPGQLDLTARWTGNTDVNLQVFVDPRNADVALLSANGFQASEFLYPGFGLDVSPSGGHIPFDDRGGPHGGTEIAYWLQAPPQAVYGIILENDGKVPANITFSAFYNKQQLYVFDINTLSYVKDYTTTVAPGTFDQDTPFVFLPASTLLPPPSDSSPTSSVRHAPRVARTPVAAPMIPAAAPMIPAEPTVASSTATPPATETSAVSRQARGR